MSAYLTYKLWKAGILLVVIFFVGIWRGLTGR